MKRISMRTSDRVSLALIGSGGCGAGAAFLFGSLAGVPGAIIGSLFGIVFGFWLQWRRVE